MKRLLALAALVAALSGCATFPHAHKKMGVTLYGVAQDIVASTGAAVSSAYPRHYGATYGASGGSEVGGFPNAAPLSGSERILADQNSTTVNLTPAQIAQYIGIPNGLVFPLSVANGGTALSTLVANDCLAANSGATAFTFVSCGSMVYPSAGLAVSTGTAWTTPITTLAGLDTFLGVTLPSTNTSNTTGDLAKWSTGGSAPVLGDSGVALSALGQLAVANTWTATQTFGTISVSSCTGCGSGGSVTLQTNGTNNSSQTTLNLANGNNVVFSNTTGGTVTGNTTQPNRTVSTTTDTISCTADAGGFIDYTGSSATAVTVPQATGSCASGFGFTIQNTGTGTVTLTPTTSTINGTSSLAVSGGNFCSIVSNGTNYLVGNCSPLLPSSGSGITLENGGTSLGTITTLNCSTGTTCSAAGAVGTLIASGGSGTPENVQTFTTSGTWTKPAGSPQTTHVWCIGAGGGGGSGAVEPSGTAAGGGGGGGGGSENDSVLATASLPSTVSVTVGAGGSGGVARTSTNTGSIGGNGGNSSFGSLLTAFGGGYGQGGQSGSNTSGGSGAGLISSGNGSTAGQVCASTAGAGSGGPSNIGCQGGGSAGSGDGSSGGAGGAAGTSVWGGTGGGGGGGLATTPVAVSGGNGGAAGSAAATTGGSAGSNGVAGSQSSGTYLSGSGGSGGGSSTTGNGGTGGAGAVGSGGGGGGAAENGVGSSGAGGNGGNGECVAVTSY